MKVLFVSSEAYPLVKTGGLADVAGALPAALKRMGEDLRLMLPAYPEALDKAEKKGRAIRLGDPLGTGETRLIPGQMPDSGLKIWLVDNPELFARDGGLYLGPDGHDWPDNHLRFALLARAAAMVCVGGNMMGWKPDVVHANDWQTGLVPAYLDQWGGSKVPSVFTIHNIHYQGLFDPDVIPGIGLRHEHFSMHGVEFHGSVSYLKSGLFYSSRITTVSPTYAREIRSTEQGTGFQGLLSLRDDDLTGVLNGIDCETWNPAGDPHIAKRYSAARPGGKEENRTALRREMKLAGESDAPLLGLVSRFVEQKGVDLVLDALPGILDKGCQVVLVGSGDPVLEQRVRDAAAADPGRVAAFIGYDENLAHRVQAGADALLVPSRFEPCGLTQLYALRYGTLPIVRRTGGLSDSVTDVDEGETGTGFLFDRAEPRSLEDAVGRAVALFRKPKDWRAVQKRAMARDFSWARSAEAYHTLYRELV